LSDVEKSFQQKIRVCSLSKSEIGKKERNRRPIVRNACVCFVNAVEKSIVLRLWDATPTASEASDILGRVEQAGSVASNIIGHISRLQ